MKYKVKVTQNTHKKVWDEGRIIPVSIVDVSTCDLESSVNS